MIDDDTIIRRIASAVIDEDQQQRLRCQRGEHAMLATASPGVVVCRTGPVWWCVPHTSARSGGKGGTPRQTETQGSPRLNRTRQRIDATEEDSTDAWVEARPHTSVRRYDLPARQSGKTTTQLPPKPTRALASRRFKREHLILWSGVAMLVMLLGFVALSWLGTWWTTTTNDWTYGRPRTSQTDHVVGHHDSPQHPSHFIALNLNRHVLVIELPGGDASKAVTYLGPVLLGDGQDLVPVTLSFEDRNGDGHIGDQVIVFLNENGTFVAPQQQ